MRSIKVRLPTEILQVTGSVNGIEVPWTRNGDMWTATCSPSEDKTYHVQLKAINSLGAEFDYAFELYDGLRLITDRTKQDVDRVNFLRKKWFAGTITPTEMTEWFSDLKGAYNASDLNRVGAAMEYISQRLADAGYGHMLNLKTDWTAADDNRTGALDYYLKTIRQLRSWFVTWPTTPDTPADLQNLTFEEANNIEKILMDLDDLINRMVQAYYYSGEIYAGGGIKMKDRVPKYPGRVYVTPENEGTPYYATIERADEPVEVGTPLNKATLLSDETAELYEKPTDTAVPDDMFKILGAERKRAIFGEKSEIESGIWDTYSYVTNNYGDELFRQITSDGKGRVIARMGGDSSDRIYYSDDYCETMNPVSTPWDYSSEVFGYMGYVCGHFIIPNSRTESDPVILISKDGINWTEKTLDWNLSGDDRIGGNKRVIGNDDWGFIFAADEYSAGYTAIKITKSGGDLIFSKSSFGPTKEASYNDGVYVVWRTEGSVQISYTTGDPESSKTNLTRPPNMNSDDTVGGCIHVGGYIVMCWSGFYTGKKPAVSVYNISAGSWSDRLYTSDSTGDIYRIGASAGKALIFLDNGTDFWIVDPKTNTVEIKSVYFSSDVVLVTMYPEDGPTVSLFPAGLNASNIYGVYKSEITKSIEYRLVDLLGNYVGNGVKIETGEYTGTGTYGASNPNTLTFNFVPKLLIIRPSAGKLEGSSISDTGMIALYGSTAFNAKSSDGNSNALAEIVWSSTSASWSGKNADAQLNANNTKYLYIAIG